MLNRLFGNLRQRREESANRSPAQAASTYTRIGLPGRPPFTPGRASLLTLGTLVLILLIATGWLARGRLAEQAPAPVPAPVEAGPAR
jgi:hypothetical protein